MENEAHCQAEYAVLSQGPKHSVTTYSKITFLFNKFIVKYRASNLVAIQRTYIFYP